MEVGLLGSKERRLMSDEAAPTPELAWVLLAAELKVKLDMLNGLKCV